MTVALFAAGLSLGPAPALAQSTAQPPANAPTTNTPSPDTVGPRELQNFNLNGTVTRPAETPPAPATRVPARRPPPQDVSPAASDSAAAPTPTRRPAQPPATARNDRPAARPGQSLALDLPATGASPTVAAPQPNLPPADEPVSATPAADQTFSFWPWLLLAGVLGAAAAFVLWRRNSREALAGGPPIDAYVAPEPVRAPPIVPQPAPEPASQPAPAPEPAAPAAGIVSTRLRPWIEIGFTPLGCIVDDERVTIEFEIQLQNSGSALARDIRVEASMFNAGPTQEQDIAGFYAEPIGQGERIEALPPLQGATIRTALVAPRANIRLLEMAGRQVFVPLVAFNALYQLGRAHGQTSVSYLLGRETKGEKLGPLRLDLGPRAFTRLGVRQLPTGIRK